MDNSTPINIERIARNIKNDIDLADASLSDSYFYNSLTLCVIDSVFSIGVKYTSVINTVDNYVKFFDLKKYRSRVPSRYPAFEEQDCLSDLIKNIDELSIDFFTKNVFQNRHRTSAINGILKTEATYNFAKALYKNSINSFDDIEKLYRNSESIKSEVGEIPGQKSGISFDYFLMLSGNTNLIKPDRWIKSYLERATGLKLTEGNLLHILTDVTGHLKSEYKNLTPRLLDHEIWKFERKQKKLGYKVQSNYSQLVAEYNAEQTKKQTMDESVSKTFTHSEQEYELLHLKSLFEKGLITKKVYEQRQKEILR